MIRARQRGVAVVTAILIVALVAGLAAAMARQDAIRLRLMENQYNRARAGAVGLAAVDWARAILAEDARKSAIDHLGEPWAAQTPPLAAEGGELSGRIIDQQGRFNLNNLVADGRIDPAMVAVFRRLLEQLALSPELAGALADWLHADREVRLPLTDLSELRQIGGFDAAVVETLRPYVTTLPAVTRINLNTAPAAALVLALEKGVEADAAAVIAARTERAFNDQADFDQRLPQLALRLNRSLAGFGSAYFLVEADIRIGKTRLKQHALLKRDGQTWPVVLLRY